MDWTEMESGELNDLIRPKDYVAGRASSWDVTGGNADFWKIAAGETKVIADITGPAVISHLWFTIASPDPLYLRKLVLQIYWDDESEPSVWAPVGDFFGVGHAAVYSYECAPFCASVSEDGPPNLSGQGVGIALNSWLPMPFHRRARVEIVNEQDRDIFGMYFYVDYRSYPSLPEDALYFHARWRRENPCDGWAGHGSRFASDAWKERMAGPEGRNTSDAGNYLILEASGRGHYVGANFAIDNLYRGWWGEGDDMIFVDRDGERAWPPDLHGTGSEDYLCHAWGMQRVAHRYSGLAWAEDPADHNHRGKVCVYRYHLADPIPFTRNIRVSIEHGHANDRSDDWSSTAYWYQSEPHQSFDGPYAVADRLPNPS